VEGVALLELLVFLWWLFFPEGDLRGRLEGDANAGTFRRLEEMLLVGLFVRVLLSMEEEGVRIFRSWFRLVVVGILVLMVGPWFTTLAIMLSPAA